MDCSSRQLLFCVNRRLSVYVIIYWYLVNQVWFCHSINEFILLRKALKTSCYLRLEDLVKYILKHLKMPKPWVSFIALLSGYFVP